MMSRDSGLLFWATLYFYCVLFLLYFICMSTVYGK